MDTTVDWTAEVEVDRVEVVIDLQSDKQTNIHTTYIRTYIHTYIHTAGYDQCGNT